MEAQGTIFDIQHFSLFDGPGVRSTVFFKGCPLHCKWCSNPESQAFQPQMLYYKSLCEKCGQCVASCPNQALHVTADGELKRSDTCVMCGKCAEICPHKAHVPSGQKMTVQEVCDEVRQHWRIFMQSGGGVTCSGGEALSQPQFLHALLLELHEKIGLHTCIETTCYAPWDQIQAILPFLDAMYVDIKHMDNTAHKQGTGQENTLILENVSKLASTGMDVTIRVPLIPEFNDSHENLVAMAKFMREKGLSKLEFLPMHVYGRSKYEALGRTWEVTSARKPRCDEALAVAGKFGLEASIQQR